MTKLEDLCFGSLLVRATGGSICICIIGEFVARLQVRNVL